MTARRTDNPRKLTVRLSEEAHRLLAALMERLFDETGKPQTVTSALEDAVRVAARVKRVSS